jgi:anti-anti-sigma factor
MYENLATITIELGDSFSYIRVAGEIDRSNADQLEQRLNESVRTGVPRIADLSAVTFLDSAGARALQLSGQRAPLRLVIPETTPIYRAVMLTGIGELMPILGSVSEAEQYRTEH